MTCIIFASYTFFGSTFNIIISYEELYQKYGVYIKNVLLLVNPYYQLFSVNVDNNEKGGCKVNTTKELNYRLYVQRESGFKRTSHDSEFEKYTCISSGDVEKVKKNFIALKNDYLVGKGVLSDDPIRNVRYHFIVAAALIARTCVADGMGRNVAYTLSDIYIQKADKCNSSERIIDLLGEMQLDFAERMREIKKTNVVSIHIRKCIDYIYDHLDERLTEEMLASYLHIDESYLSKLFLKEMGIHLKKFITNARVDAAKNMLIYSDYSYLEISLSLGFSSQSAFISIFRKVTGTTPGKFRTAYKGSLHIDKPGIRNDN